MLCKTQNSEWTHSFQVYRRAEQLCHFLFRNMSGSVFIPESVMFRIVSKMCDVLEANKMPYRTPELLIRLQNGDEGDKPPGKGEQAHTEQNRANQNRIRRFCKNHTDNPTDTILYELYRTAEIFTAALDCGKLLCCDEDQHLPWSKPMVMDIIHATAAILQAEGYPAEIPTDLIDNQ